MAPIAAKSDQVIAWVVLQVVAGGMRLRRLYRKEWFTPTSLELSLLRVLHNRRLQRLTQAMQQYTDSFQALSGVWCSMFEPLAGERLTPKGAGGGKVA